MKKSKKTGRVKLVLSVLSVVLLLVYFVYQTKLISKEDYSTQVVMKTEDLEHYNCNGFIVRDERYITSGYSGMAVTLVKNGERVTKGDTVCLVFKDTAAAEDYVRIKALEKEIKRYEQLSGQANIQTFDVSSINADIKDRCRKLQSAADSGNLSSLSDRVDDFRNSVTSLQIATGSTFSFQEKLGSLRNELSQLTSSSLPYEAVTADSAGYFSGYSDGFENSVSISDIDNISPELLHTIFQAKAASVQSNVRGKLIKGFKWYILCVVENKYFGELKNTDDVYVNIPLQGIERLPTKVHSFGNKGAEKTVLVLECNLMNESLCTLRSADLQIIIKEHEGYKIDSAAVRVLDGQQGVYVKTGNLIRFRKINVIYATDEYVISAPPEDGASGYVRLYDEVILKGEDLFDGKLIG
ncbi:MAG: HlyD family efflux transporter periplasmic adaptor subunit [Acutalibacteraceae bacterium]